MTTPFDAPDWRTMSQEARDRGLNNGEAVRGSADIIAGWDARSAKLRDRLSDHLDLVILLIDTLDLHLAFIVCDTRADLHPDNPFVSPLVNLFGNLRPRNAARYFSRVG